MKAFLSIIVRLLLEVLLELQHVRKGGGNVSANSTGLCPKIQLIPHVAHYENKTKPRMIKHQLIREQVDRRANSVIFSLNQMLNHF